MNLTWIAMLLTIALFVGMLITFEVGRRIGVARLKRDPEGLTKGAGAAEGAVFALLGLLLAFTFSGAASRFEARRFYIDTEANAIGTAYLRLDLLPEESQAPLRDLFRRYTDNRATVYQGSDLDAVKRSWPKARRCRSEIWKQAVAACRLPGASSQAAMLLLPALNEMIDITATRVTATTQSSPGRHLPVARGHEPARRDAGRIRHFGQQGPQPVPPGNVCAGHVAGDLRDRRS